MVKPSIHSYMLFFRHKDRADLGHIIQARDTNLDDAITYSYTVLPDHPSNWELVDSYDQGPTFDGKIDPAWYEVATWFLVFGASLLIIYVIGNINGYFP